MRADGGFVVTWEHVPTSGPNQDIVARLYNPNGTPQSAPFFVSTSTANAQFQPSVDMNDSGAFVIVWESVRDDGGREVRGQRFDAAGAPQGGEFSVTPPEAGRRLDAKVGMDNAGNFVVTWTDYDPVFNNGFASLGVYAQRYDSSGVAQGATFRVDPAGAGYAFMPDIAMEPNGDFVIAWTNSDQTGSFGTIYARRFDAAGNALGGASQVSSGHLALGASVAVDADGDSVVAWMGYSGTFDTEIYARQYDSNGVPVSSQERVNTETHDTQWYPSVSSSAEGHFVIVWSRRDNVPGGDDIWGRVYNAEFGEAGNEFPVNHASDESETYGHVAMSPDGNFVATWTKNDYEGIYAIRYSLDPIELSQYMVAENAPAGTVIGTFSTIDTVDGTYTYELISGPGDIDNGQFQIVGNQLRVLTPLNFEAKSIFNIRVRSSDGLGGQSEHSFTIEAIDVDEFNVSPITDVHNNPNRVPENAAPGTFTGIIARATDADGTQNQVTYSLWNTHTGRFAIDRITGVVTVGNGVRLNRETEASWAVTVLATSIDGSVSVREFIIEIEDVNEYLVSAVTDLDPAFDGVLEMSPYRTPVPIKAFAVDYDATRNRVTYSLASSAAGYFLINANTGALSLSGGNSWNRETEEFWLVSVVATSEDGSSRAKEFKVHIIDVDEYDVGPVFDLNSAPNSVSENASNGTNVGITGFGIDLDATTSDVTYSLTDNAGGRFTIDAVTGVVTVANGAILNREETAWWPIMIRAQSEDGSFSTKQFSISLSDVDEFDVGPITDSNASPNSVPENAAAGTLVGITAKGVDDATATITYSLTNNASGRFLINSTTGVVSVAPDAILDFEAQASHQITVQAVSSDGSMTSQSFTIDVTNSFDIPRIALSNDTVVENLPAGTIVGTLQGADIEAGAQRFTLVSGDGSTDNSRFSISGDQLKTRVRLDAESKATYSIRVQMRFDEGTVLTQVFTVQVADSNDGPTGLTLTPATIAENNAVGDPVGTLLGLDQDAVDMLNYTLVSGRGSTDNAKFTIDGNQLKANESFDYERKRSYSIRVRVTDASGLTYEKGLTIRVLNGLG